MDSIYGRAIKWIGGAIIATGVPATIIESIAAQKIADL